MALVKEPRFADRMMEQITDIYIESCNQYLEQVGQYLQVFTYWDDVCGQDGWLISPAIYRQRIKPKQRRLLEAIKRKTDARCTITVVGRLRSDPGPDRAGVRHSQPGAGLGAGYGYQAAQTEFGRDIVFWGAAWIPSTCFFLARRSR